MIGAQLFNNVGMTEHLSSLLKLFLFLLPWQTVYIFSEVFLGGAKLEFATESFYLTEALLWVIIILFFSRYIAAVKARKKITWHFSKDRQVTAAFGLLAVWAMISGLWSTDPSLSLQTGLRIMEGFFLFLILSAGPLGIKDTLRWLLYGAILPMFLGAAQFYFETTFSSTWLGLSEYNVDVGGTAVIESGGERILRAYGSFSHPNVFGGYLAIIFAASTFLLSQVSKKDKETVQLHTIFHIGIILLLVITFSRSAFLGAAAFFVVSFFFLKKNKQSIGYSVAVRKTFYTFLILVAIMFPLFSTRINADGRLEQKSVQERTNQMVEAKDIISNNWLTGIGAGSYSLHLAQRNPGQPGWFYQPVHNAFLLLLAELGVIGITLLSWGLYSMVTLTRLPLKFLALPLFLAVFDHYLYSSYAGIILFFLYLALVTQFYPRFVHSSSTASK